METKYELCWHCGEPISEDEAVPVNIDGALEPLHEDCCEFVAESVDGTRE